MFVNPAGQRPASRYDDAVGSAFGGSVRKQESALSYFNASKIDRDSKIARSNGQAEPVQPAVKTAEQASVIASGMQVTGNIVCTGSLQIFGRVTGDIHAAQLAIREGARVEGKITATEAVIEGAFNGTIHGNTVKLQKTAAVEGEIFNKALAIEEHARFEGVSRRLDRAVEGPTAAQLERDPGAGAAAFASAPLTAPAK
jgi:cytoskeletal protein CcmA (bactofilin family)